MKKVLTVLYLCEVLEKVKLMEEKKISTLIESGEWGWNREGRSKRVFLVFFDVRVRSRIYSGTLTN